MDGLQGLTALIESAWEELNSSDAGRRDLCLDVVSEVLETGRLMPDDAEQAVERLVTVALSDESYPVRGSALHAACTASTHYKLPYRVVEPLAVSADGFEPCSWTTSWQSSARLTTKRRCRWLSGSSSTPTPRRAGRRRRQ
ncbi:hypothetical protein [Streptomyces sp. NPDC002587]